MLLSYFYKIKTKIRYLILVLTPIGNPPIIQRYELILYTGSFGRELYLLSFGQLLEQAEQA